MDAVRALFWNTDWKSRRLEPWCERAKIVNVKIEPMMTEAPFGELKSADLSLEAKVLELNEEQRVLFMLVPDREEDKGAIAQGKCKLLQLTIVEVVKYTFNPRPRGWVIVESEMGSDEYKRVGLFRGFSGSQYCFEEVAKQIIKLV